MTVFVVFSTIFYAAFGALLVVIAASSEDRGEGCVLAAVCGVVLMLLANWGLALLL